MMTQQLFLLFCSLACVVFSANGVAPRHGLAWLAGWLLAVLLIRPQLLGLPFISRLLIEPQQIALSCVLLAALLIKQPQRRLLAITAGGFMGVVWSMTLLSAGAPATIAWLFPLICGLGTLLANRYRRDFTSPRLQEEANVIILLAALTVALIPDIINSWQSAVTLQGDADMPRMLNGLGVFFIAATLMACGALYANWKYKR